MHRSRWSQPPVLVYQMGKVGSSSVYRSLRDLDLPGGVEHVHLLENLDAVEASVRSAYADPAGSLRQIRRGREIRARMRRSRDVQWKVVSLVRDPVERNVSAFFQNLDQVLPDARERHARGELPTDELRDAFVERYDHNAPLLWFQTQLEPVFGIDVFATPFDTASGFTTYESPTASLLVIRLEDLPRCGDLAIAAFLGVDGFTLQARNVGNQKWYADLYAEFQREVVLPPEYLDAMYDSAFAQHFYDDRERAGFRSRWEVRVP